MPAILNAPGHPHQRQPAGVGTANGARPAPIDMRGREAEGARYVPVRNTAPAAVNAGPLGGEWPDLKTLQQIRHTVEEMELATTLAANSSLGRGLRPEDFLRLGMTRMRELKAQADMQAQVEGYSLNAAAYEIEFADHARRTGQPRDGVREGMIRKIADREGGLLALLNASDDEILRRFRAMVTNSWVGG